MFQQTLHQLVRLELVVTDQEDKPVYTVTTKGLVVYNQINEGKEESKPALVAAPPAQDEIMLLHAALQNRLHKHIDKKQILGFGNVPFIPSLKDLGSFLARFRKDYPNLWDIKKIEKCLFKHIDKCATTKKYSPAIKYFIIKEGSGSQLSSLLEAEDFDSDDEMQHKIKNTKDLFD